MGEDDIGAFGFFGLDHSGETGEAALAALLVHFVDVIDKNEGQTHGVGGAGGPGVGQGRDEGGGAQLEGVTAMNGFHKHILAKITATATSSSVAFPVVNQYPTIMTLS
jgi:hypothetical protein